MRQSIRCMAVTSFLSIFLFVACKKEGGGEQPAAETKALAAKQDNGHLTQTKTFSSEVALKWQDLQLRILRLPAGVNPYGLNGVRNFAYTGIALYESVVPGMPSYQSLDGQLTDMPQMPVTLNGKAYHWPTSANAALAYMTRHFYTSANTSPALIVSMDSLENALNASYQLQVEDAIFERSKEFGRTVAEKIFTWSTTDGSLAVNPPYVPAALPLWNNSAPNPAGIVGPYWGNNRPFVQGSTAGTASPLPPVYSTDPNSPYYAMVKEVYDVSQSLTPVQIATAMYFNDEPGFKAGTHYLSIFNQVMHLENPTLDFYAVAQAKTGIAMAEAMINCWKIKYSVLLDRPIRYIRTVLNHPSWNPLIPTHPHPDFPSGHTQNAGAFTTVMASLFGPQYHFTIHTYDELGLPPRSYNSFDELAADVAKARVYGGIHYTYSCSEGKLQGSKIASNILTMLQFQK